MTIYVSWVDLYLVSKIRGMSEVDGRIKDSFESCFK
jgi:hypothetical protein